MLQKIELAKIDLNSVALRNLYMPTTTKLLHDGPLSCKNIISHSWAVNSEFGQLYSKATAKYGCTKSELTGANQRFGI
jgi:hypothetical protein